MAPAGVWIRLLRENGGADRAYLGRLCGILLATALAGPLRVLERAVYAARVRRAEVAPPLMILGYGRSGTTHLHNLLAQDPNHGSVTTLQCIVPTFFLLADALPRGLLNGLAPATRPMDNVRVALDLPQEEELAIANSTHLSFLHHLSFPRRTRRLHRRYARMEGLDERELAEWARVYRAIARKAAFRSRRRRLVLKSPSNLVRLGHVLGVFPEARFVHIVRNPYTVYASLVNMYRKLMPAHQLQAVGWAEVERGIVRAYRSNMRRYLGDRALIPPGRLVEMRFEDLEADPVGELRRVYGGLGLEGWAAAKPAAERYLESLRGYRKNRFELDSETVARVESQWAFALDEWGYAPPEPE